MVGLMLPHESEVRFRQAVVAHQFTFDLQMKKSICALRQTRTVSSGALLASVIRRRRAETVLSM